MKDGDGSVLSWTTQVDPLVPDKLVVGFRNPSPAPTTMRLTATSMSLSATLEITLVDAYGHVFAPRPATWVLAQGVQTSIEFRLDSTTDTAGAGAKLGTTQRVIIVDSEDYVTFEWKRGDGVVFPPPPAGLEPALKEGSPR